MIYYFNPNCSPAYADLRFKLFVKTQHGLIPLDNSAIDLDYKRIVPVNEPYLQTTVPVEHDPKQQKYHML